jgi:hypothetical protein
LLSQLLLLLSCIPGRAAGRKPPPLLLPLLWAWLLLSLALLLL